MTNGPVIRLEKIARDFFDGKRQRRVLNDVSLGFYSNEFAIISGPSGSGKTTLLTIMALILQPSEGSVYIRDEEMTGLGKDALATYRYRYYGFVFQNAALIPALTVMENIALAAAVQGGRVSPAVRRRAMEILEVLDMGEFAFVKSERLSGGQKQRVAVARALINDPLLILCDEPTSALDVESGEAVLSSLKRLSREGKAIVLVTHDTRVFPYADRLIQLQDGAVVTDTGAADRTGRNGLS